MTIPKLLFLGKKEPHTSSLPMNWSLKLKAVIEDFAVRTFQLSVRSGWQLWGFLWGDAVLLLFSVLVPAVWFNPPRLRSRSAALAKLSGQGFNSLWRCRLDHGFSQSHHERATSLLVCGVKCNRHCGWNGYSVDICRPIALHSLEKNVQRFKRLSMKDWNIFCPKKYPGILNMFSSFICKFPSGRRKINWHRNMNHMVKKIAVHCFLSVLILLQAHESPKIITDLAWPPKIQCWQGLNQQNNMDQKEWKK